VLRKENHEYEKIKPRKYAYLKERWESKKDAYIDGNQRKMPTKSINHSISIREKHDSLKIRC